MLDGRDVVIADVEEGGGGEVGAQGAVVFQRLAGHLHHQIVQSRLRRPGEVALEVQGVGGGDVGFEALHPVVGVDGGDDPALRPALGRQEAVQDMLQIVGGGGLALGPRQADHLQFPRGVAEEQVGQGGDGGPHVVHLEAGQGRARVGPFAHVGDGALVLSHLEELRLEVGPLAEEQGAGDHLPGIVGHQLHRGGPVQLLRDGGGQQISLLQQGDIVIEGALHKNTSVQSNLAQGTPG